MESDRSARRCVLTDKLSRIVSAICLLGTVDVSFASLRMWVLRKPIFFDGAAHGIGFTTSPGANGLSKK